MTKRKAEVLTLDEEGKKPEEEKERVGEGEEKEGETLQPSAKIAPIFLSSAQKSHGTWRILPGQLMIFSSQENTARSKIAGFDLDSTLIKTKSGRVFPANTDDWQFWSRGTIGRLRKCYADGFKLCIFTNQMGIQKKLVQPGAFKNKIQNICGAIGVPIQVFVSIGTPNYRKPFTGMWDKLEQSENDLIKIDRANCFYVGDAAGRIKTSTRQKADHSCADRLFAMNLGVKFRTPEQFFFPNAPQSNEEEPFKLPEFRPAKLLEQPNFVRETEDSGKSNNKNNNKNNDNSSPISNFFSSPQMPGPLLPEVIVLVGSPASGKSTFSQKHRKHYAVISQDELRTWQECLERATSALRCGRSVIIDNTNRSPEVRKRYCEMARALAVPCRCFIFDCSLGNSLHNNEFRKIIDEVGDTPHKNVNEVAIRAFFAEYKKPQLEEGFSEICLVHFKPEFQSEEHRRIYGMYLIEKVN